MNCAITESLRVVSEGAAAAMTMLGRAALDVTLSDGAVADVQIAIRAAEDFEPNIDSIVIHASSEIGSFILDLPMAAVDWLCDILLVGWRDQQASAAFRELRTAFVLDALLQKVGLADHQWTLLETVEAPSNQPMPLALYHEEGVFLFGIWVVDCNPRAFPPRREVATPPSDLADLSVRLQMSLPPVKSALRDLTEIELGDLFVLPGEQAQIPVQLCIGNSKKVTASVAFDGGCTIGYEED